MCAVVRAWQLTSDLYPLPCYGLDMQDRQLLELASQMTVSNTWGSAAEVQFYAKHVILLGQTISRERRDKESSAKASRVLERKLFLCWRAGLSVDLWLTSLGEAFWGNLKWI